MTGRAGILLLDKPAGITSHDAVAITRRALDTRRVGHCGTLDPAASGLLVVCIGGACRLSQWLTAHRKAYTATIRLGVETSTLDSEGAVTATSDASTVTEPAVERALRSHTGPQLQVPPAASAIKVGGRRLYDLARKGVPVEPAPREVTVYRADLLQFNAGAEATAVVEFEVSSGTYIRSLSRDIGAAIGCGGTLAALRRTWCGVSAVAAFRVTEAIDVFALREHPDPWQYVQPAVRGLIGWPIVHVDADGAEALRHGRPVTGQPDGDARLVAAVCDRELVAVCKAEGGGVSPVCVLPA